ncbi:MAG: DUF362 domain-containing protein [Candidatus Lokiarchaeota archaeon]|nr:DUF362 domain-containing protein [Candidatus Lokiarchaeota archaeon]
MSDKSKVYWASPNEVAALKNTSANMVTNKLVKTRLILDKILDNINSGDQVAIKVHVGEAQNTHYLRHDYIHEVVKAVKSLGGIPTLIETQGGGNHLENIEICEDYSVCVVHRTNASEHKEIAKLHGYDESIVGAPLEFIDGENGIKREIVELDGISLKKVSLGKDLFNYDKLIVVSHFKGHPQAGFGGALKQLGIGCVTKHNKHLAHMDGMLTINPRKCDISLCKQECVGSCPVEAISIENEKARIDAELCYGCYICFQQCPINRAIKKPKRNQINEFTNRFIDSATAVIKSFGSENIRYINFALEIPLMCDCVPNAGMVIVPDLGIYGSSDPVAIDKACFDAETEAPGLPILKEDGQWTKPLEPGVEKFKAMLTMLNPFRQFEDALKNKIGLTTYELIQI